MLGSALKAGTFYHIKFVKGGSLHVGKVTPGHAAPPEELERAREAGTF